MNKREATIPENICCLQFKALCTAIVDGKQELLKFVNQRQLGRSYARIFVDV